MRGWWSRLALVAIGALAVRLGYVLIGTDHQLVIGDAFFYHHQANLVASGHGFISPSHFIFLHRTYQAGDHPPLFTLVLAAASALGGRTVLVHQLVNSGVGVAAVVMIGLLGREVAGDRAGLVAAAIAAVYPNVWVSDGLVMSESLAILLVAATLLAVYRLLRGPTPLAAAAAGALCALCALARPELLLLLPLVVLPIAWRSAATRRIPRVVAAVVAAALVIAPWAGYNASRFDHPVVLSTGLGITLANSNCDQTWYGPGTGFWFFGCNEKPTLHGDQSTVEIGLRRRSLDYIGDHLSRLPAVAAARFGLLWGLYRPMQMVRWDIGAGRQWPVSVVALVMFYALAALAVLGVVALRRTGRSSWPLLAVPVIVTVSVLLTHAETRYRAPAEVAIVVLAAVAIDRLLPRRRGAPAGASTAAGEAVPAP